MNDVNILKRYIEDFTLLLKRNVKPEIYFHSFVFPILADGAVFEIKLEIMQKSIIGIKNEFPDITSCIKTLDLKIVSPGSNAKIHFGGTNFFLLPNRIVIIKGENDKWSNDYVIDDFNRFLSAITGRIK